MGEPLKLATLRGEEDDETSKGEPKKLHHVGRKGPFNREKCTAGEHRSKRGQCM